MDVLRKSSHFLRKYIKANIGTDENNPRRFELLHSRILPSMIRHRYRTMVAVVVLILLLEIAEHLIILRYGLRTHQIFDAVLYTLFTPALTWLMLTMLERTESAREQAAINMDLQTELSQRLGDANTWDELVECIAAFPQQVAPQASAVLYVYHPNSRSPRAEASCSRSGEITLRPQIPLSPELLPLGSLPQLLLQNNFTPQAPGPAASVKGEVLVVPPAPLQVGADCIPTSGEAPASAALPSPPPAGSALPPNRYDLLITRNNQKIGVLKLEYPHGSGASKAQLSSLKHAAPLIALALEGALLQNLAAEQAAASEADRQQIAQNLHDTLAQNISYLRLKLDQLTGENAIREIGVVLQELERMRATADEAYAQVRHTLDELAPIQAEDLVTSVAKQARAICDRAALKLRTSQVGAPYNLPGPVRQQILYIAREALHNVEKHAGAERVHLQFLWLEGELIIKIVDDGVGFDPLALPQDGHYGLWIMQQRAEDMGGTLKISPSEEKGTEVTLWVPRPAYQRAAAEKV